MLTQAHNWSALLKHLITQASFLTFKIRLLSIQRVEDLENVYKGSGTQTLLHGYLPIFPDARMSFLFYGFRVKKSWIVTCNYRAASYTEDTVLLSQGLRVWWGRRRARGWQTEEKALRAVCSGSSSLYQEAGNTVLPPPRLVVLDSFLHQPVRHGCWGLRTEQNPVGFSVYQSSEAEGVKQKVLGPNKPALSGRNLEPEQSTGTMAIPFHAGPHEAISCPQSDFMRSCLRSCKGL